MSQIELDMTNTLALADYVDGFTLTREQGYALIVLFAVVIFGFVFVMVCAICFWTRYALVHDYLRFLEISL